MTRNLLIEALEGNRTKAGTAVWLAALSADELEQMKEQVQDEITDTIKFLASLLRLKAAFGEDDLSAPTCRLDD